MSNFTIALFGHRVLDDPLGVMDLLDSCLRQLLTEHDFLTVLVGRNGEFDQLAASVVRGIKTACEQDCCQLILMLPYPTAEYTRNAEQFEQYFDAVDLSPAAYKAHPKHAITLRNKDMVDRADLVIGYVKHNHGGAYQALLYAQKEGKTAVNLFE